MESNGNGSDCATKKGAPGSAGSGCPYESAVLDLDSNRIRTIGGDMEKNDSKTNEQKEEVDEMVLDEPDFHISPEHQINFYNFMYFWGTAAIYALIGGWIFRALEYAPELNRIQAHHNTIQVGRQQLLQAISTSCAPKPNSNPNGTQAQLLAALSEYELLLSDIVNGELDLYLNSTVDHDRTEWGSFPKAVSFVIVLTTTIGYGNITPKTAWGRAFCIGYALIGIPLMLIAISKTGKTYSTLASRIYRRICRDRFDWKYLQAKNPTNMQLVVGTSVSLSGVLLLLFVYMSLGALVYMWSQGWSFIDSLYFCFITLTTIGLGDLTPKYEPTQAFLAVVRSVYILTGLAVTSTAIELVRKQYTLWNRPWKRRLEIKQAQMAAAICNHTPKGGRECISEALARPGQVAKSILVGAGADDKQK